MDDRAVETWILEKLARELSPDLLYHGVHHTRDVVGAAERLAEMEGVGARDRLLLRTAALLHDAGFLTTRAGHEEESIRIAREVLPAYGYRPDEIEAVCEMIAATRIPQSPRSRLGRILCDADLDYLGRDDFEEIAETLRRERERAGLVVSSREWREGQVRFLGEHAYFTASARRLRDEGKRRRLEALRRELRGS